MKFKCLNKDCGKMFMYPAKTIESTDQHPTLVTETHVCPFCLQREFDEFVEPQPQIVSVKSVPIEDVDALIKEGYVVLEVYAKTCNLIKKEVKNP